VAYVSPAGFIVRFAIGIQLPLIPLYAHLFAHFAVIAFHLPSRHSPARSLINPRINVKRRFICTSFASFLHPPADSGDIVIALMSRDSPSRSSKLMIFSRASEKRLRAREAGLDKALHCHVRVNELCPAIKLSREQSPLSVISPRVYKTDTRRSFPASQPVIKRYAIISIGRTTSAERILGNSAGREEERSDISQLSLTT
jgi:hypothetical protein